MQYSCHEFRCRGVRKAKAELKLFWDIVDCQQNQCLLAVPPFQQSRPFSSDRLALQVAVCSNPWEVQVAGQLLFFGTGPERGETPPSAAVERRAALLCWGWCLGGPRPPAPGLGLGLELGPVPRRRTRVGDAGGFHERAFVLCGARAALQQSLRSAGRPSARLVGTEKQNEPGGGFLSQGKYFRFPLYGEIPVFPRGCTDKTPWEEHPSSFSRLA